MIESCKVLQESILDAINWEDFAISFSASGLLNQIMPLELFQDLRNKSTKLFQISKWRLCLYAVVYLNAMPIIHLQIPLLNNNGLRNYDFKLFYYSGVSPLWSFSGEKSDHKLHFDDKLHMMSNPLIIWEVQYLIDYECHDYWSHFVNLINKDIQFRHSIEVLNR